MRTLGAAGPTELQNEQGSEELSVVCQCPHLGFIVAKVCSSGILGQLAVSCTISSGSSYEAVTMLRCISRGLHWHVHVKAIASVET